MDKLNYFLILLTEKYNIVGYIFSFVFIFYGVYALLGNRVPTKTQGFTEISGESAVFMISVGVTFLYFLLTDKNK